jgi:hypothetical protein
MQKIKYLIIINLLALISCIETNNDKENLIQELSLIEKYIGIEDLNNENIYNRLKNIRSKLESSTYSVIMMPEIDNSSYKAYLLTRRNFENNNEKAIVNLNDSIFELYPDSNGDFILDIKKLNRGINRLGGYIINFNYSDSVYFGSEIFIEE